MRTDGFVYVSVYLFNFETSPRSGVGVLDTGPTGLKETTIRAPDTGLTCTTFPTTEIVKVMVPSLKAPNALFQEDVK